MENKNIVILGAGISSLSAGYYLKLRGNSPILLEKDCTYGGLCGNFFIDGFEFDRFVHLSFAKDEEVNRVFSLSVPQIIRHIPNPYNIYKGLWIKHPAQNNLYPLSQDEKDRVINDFKNRPEVALSDIHNYEDWLRVQYGNYFAEKFPMVYTRKYWMSEARELETKWIGDRLYQPSIDEVIAGSKTYETPVTYYAKEMRYPETGGYKSFLNELITDQDVRYDSCVVEIDTKSKIVITKKGETFSYDNLISSLPLTELVKIVKDIPDEIQCAASKLKCTSGYLVSIGLKTENIPPYLWWYIYDEDILAARVYSPSLKSSNNAPDGCSSLQMEVYCNENQYSESELYSRSVEKLIEMNIINKEDILFVDIRFEKYANVIFDNNIYTSRDIVKNYFKSIGINTIGRFGEWEYFWSDQSFLSGKNILDKI
jgi:protoporphyrinogen oxidase